MNEIVAIRMNRQDATRLRALVRRSYAFHEIDGTARLLGLIDAALASPEPSGHDAPGAEELLDAYDAATMKAGFSDTESYLDMIAARFELMGRIAALERAAMTQARGTGEAGRETRG